MGVTAGEVSVMSPGVSLGVVLGVALGVTLGATLVEGLGVTLGALSLVQPVSAKTRLRARARPSRLRFIAHPPIHTMRHSVRWLVCAAAAQLHTEKFFRGIEKRLAIENDSCYTSISNRNDYQ